MALRPSTELSIVGITEQDWRQVRELRMQALADTPHAFLETLLHAAEQSDENWMARARRCERPDYTGFAAVMGGRWVGTMRAEITAEGPAYLLGVFVAPAHRGRSAGVADALLDRIEHWAADAGAPTMLLEVHEDNDRAQRFYRRRGYTFTGKRVPYPLAEQEFELEMSRSL